MMFDTRRIKVCHYLDGRFEFRRRDSAQMLLQQSKVSLIITKLYQMELFYS